MKKSVFLFALCLAGNGWAGVYKCTDQDGKTDYRSSPCTESDKAAMQMNTKTGGSVDLDAEEKRQALEAEQRKLQESQQQSAQQAKAEEIVRRKQLAQTEYAATKAVIQKNPTQFSAYAIPVYDPEKLPALVKNFEARLPDIERFRRLAALKALAGGQCQRVEADELNSKSSMENLVVLVNCSSGAALYYNESELK